METYKSSSKDYNSNEKSTDDFECEDLFAELVMLIICVFRNFSLSFIVKDNKQKLTKIVK